MRRAGVVAAHPGPLDGVEEREPLPTRRHLAAVHDQPEVPRRQPPAQRDATQGCRLRHARPHCRRCASPRCGNGPKSAEGLAAAVDSKPMPPKSCRSTLSAPGRPGGGGSRTVRDPHRSSPARGGGHSPKIRARTVLPPIKLSRVSVLATALAPHGGWHAMPRGTALGEA